MQTAVITNHNRYQVVPVYKANNFGYFGFTLSWIEFREKFPALYTALESFALNASVIVYFAWASLELKSLWKDIFITWFAMRKLIKCPSSKSYKFDKSILS